MANAKTLAGKPSLGIRLARSLYGRWHRMRRDERERLRALAESAKDLALDVRGAGDQPTAERELYEANERLADAIVESAESDPDVPEIEVRRLRADLARELERLASAQIRASRGTGERTQ
jgi:hypothetical protein